MKELRWGGRFAENISDGIWVKPGKCRQYYKKNEAVFVFWDAVPEADYPASRSINPFDKNKWNKSFD